MNGWQREAAFWNWPLLLRLFAITTIAHFEGVWQSSYGLNFSTVCHIAVGGMALYWCRFTYGRLP